MSKKMKWILFSIAFLWLSMIGIESYQLGFASGQWIGRFSVKWALILAIYATGAVSSLIILYQYLFRNLKGEIAAKSIPKLKKWMGKWSWIGAFIIILIPTYPIFFSTFGNLYTGFASRLLLFGFSVWALTFWLQVGKTAKNNFQEFLRAGLMIGVGLVLAESFSLVSDYPFSLHWSEGNRIWDYSIMFGADRYNVLSGKEIFAFIDPGRQALWGLPFIFPNVTIWIVRFWSAFLVTIPYALLGWFAFRPIENKIGQGFLLGLWAMIFLNQGPIYTPLIFSAIIILGLRRRPLWIALPLAFLAGHYAGISRFTWSFAPAIWVLIMTLADATKDWGEIRKSDWLRAGTLAIAAMWTKGLPIIIGIISEIISLPGGASQSAGEPAAYESLTGLTQNITNQPLLWYRLLPNEVFAPGILIGLALATLPLSMLLIVLIKKDIWRISPWSHKFNLIALFGFLAVGIVASAKVGGGLDLHNLDMFFIALIFLGSMAWEASDHEKIGQLISGSINFRILLAAIVLIPGISPTLTGRPPERMASDLAQSELEIIQDRVACAAQYGEVLFMDQRQLITFGHMGDINFLDEYEKKLVMNQALSDNAEYFQNFEIDLANREYAMIVTEQQATRYRQLDVDTLGDSLVEENNAWVKWVTAPMLQYYESVYQSRGTDTEIFLPIERDFDC